jgi:hypothetical protein
VSAACTNLTAAETPIDANIAPETVIDTDPEDGAFEEAMLEMTALANVISDAIEDC